MKKVLNYIKSKLDFYAHRTPDLRKAKGKFSEALASVLPIIIIVFILGFALIRLETSTMLCFIFGALFLIAGSMLFTLGAEMSMSKIGEKVGSSLTKMKKIWLIVAVALVLGTIITVSEPDLTVLATQLEASIPKNLMIYSVAIGVGVFLMLAVLRTIFNISLNFLLILSYSIIFLLTFFIPKDFFAIAFDSGGVTTGPMTVPFIMAFGVGLTALRSDKNASNDSFGLVALCSAGPIIAVEVLGIIYKPESADFSPIVPFEVNDSVELGKIFIKALPTYIKEIAFSLLPILVFFIIFQIFVIKMPKKSLNKIFSGLLYTYVGLVLFMTGANIGFLPVGFELGQKLALSSTPWVLVPIAMIMGFFVVKAEPAVYVLNKQVEEMTDGAISAKLMGTCLSFGVSASLGLAMIRVITGISILWFLVPGYAIAIVSSFFVPKLYTAIAFDSGGVASGPMTAAFLLPLSEGACLALGGNVMCDAFGVVAMVAMTPLITVQLLGIVARFKSKQKTTISTVFESNFAALDNIPDNVIIDL